VVGALVADAVPVAFAAAVDVDVLAVVGDCATTTGSVFRDRLEHAIASAVQMTRARDSLGCIRQSPFDTPTKHDLVKDEPRAAPKSRFELRSLFVARLRTSP
jgi:hypothetical protein